MKSKPYPEYKDSGVQWIGEIPKEWEFHKINQIFEIIGSGTTPNSQNEIYYDNGVIPWVITGDLNNSILNDTSKKISREAHRDHSTLKLYEKNSLIIAMYGATIGKISLLNLEACVNQACCVLANSKILVPKFAFYWFLANKSNIISLSYGGGQPNISQDTIKSLRIQVPTLLEQEKIIPFLDKKTSEIDLTIEKDTCLIELLKEKRTALINHVVTKGLDPTVKMKDSGVEWIGEIPEYWNIMKLKHVVANKITDGPHETPELLDQGVPFISVDAIKKDKIDFSRMRGFISEHDHRKFCHKCKPQKDDVFLIKSGATTGNVAIVETDEDFSIWSPLALIRADKTIMFSRLLYYILLSDYFKRLIEISWSYGTQQNIGMGVIENLSIVVPNIREQNLLLDYLDKETSNIDLIIKKIQKNIELLEEYKKSLIHHVVTGKVDVREVAV